MAENRVCVLFQYYEKNSEYRLNLLHFLSYGITSGITCVVLVSGDHSRDLPRVAGVRYVYLPNKGYDYSAVSWAVHNLDDVCSSDYLVVVNSTVRGPFIPFSAVRVPDWTVLFLAPFSESRVGLVGPTICSPPPQSSHVMQYLRMFPDDTVGPWTHVPTTAYALSAQALQALKTSGFFDQPHLPRDRLVAGYELRLSRLVLKAGFRLRSLQPQQNTLSVGPVAFAQAQSTAKDGDVLYLCGFDGRTLHPFELLFIKTSRRMWTEACLGSLARSMALERKPLPAYAEYLERLAVCTEERQRPTLLKRLHLSLLRRLGMPSYVNQ